MRLLGQIEKWWLRVLDRKQNWGEVGSRGSYNLTAMVCNDEHNVNILPNMLFLPVEGNFQEEPKKSLNPAMVYDYNKTYGVSRWIWQNDEP